MRGIRVRYSLRMLLAAMAIVPAAAYWLGLPTLNAHRFAKALESGDYEAAERMCVEGKQPHPREAKDWLSFRASVRIEKGTWRDWALGKRRMTYYWEAHAGSHVMAFNGSPCVATRRGIEFLAEEK